jgi:hypothetical protein
MNVRRLIASIVKSSPPPAILTGLALSLRGEAFSSRRAKKPHEPNGSRFGRRHQISPAKGQDMVKEAYLILVTKLANPS